MAKAKATKKKAAPKKKASKRKLTKQEADFAKIQKTFKNSAHYKAGTHLIGIQLAALDLQAGYTCDKRVRQITTDSQGHTVITWVCVKWSDGQDHSNDPDVPDTP